MKIKKKLMNYYKFNKYSSLKSLKDQFFFISLKYIYSQKYIYRRICLIHKINQVVDIEKECYSGLAG